MWHEQSRPDRDDYVRILKDNIQLKRLGNYMGNATISVLIPLELRMIILLLCTMDTILRKNLD